MAKGNTHGNIENVRLYQECHQNHQGRDFDMLAYAIAIFDHTVIDFHQSQLTKAY